MFDDELDDDSDITDEAPEPEPADPIEARRLAVRKAVQRYRSRLQRKLAGLHEDLAESKRGAEFRRYGETLLAYAYQVPARASSVSLPDPTDPSRTLEIALDPAVAPPANAARYFKKAGKAERGLKDTPPRIAAVEAEIADLSAKLDALAQASAGDDDAALYDATIALERVLFELGSTVRQQIKAPEPLSRRELGVSAANGQPRSNAARPQRAPQAGAAGPGKLVPMRFTTVEGWDVLIGRSSEGNDHLTVHMARPEDYWFHAHGCPGSHVVLRRGKGPNEPSRATLEEVASWAAWHSKARTAGKVPVHWTLKKYVRKPRGAKAGLVYIEREQALMVRPVEPPKERMSDVVDDATNGGEE